MAKGVKRAAPHATEAAPKKAKKDSESEASSPSEDELDELDDLAEDDSSNLSDAELSDETEALPEKEKSDPEKKTLAEQHSEQKRLLAERKLKRKAGREVERIKALWEKLRVKKPAPSKEVRDRLCSEIWDLAKDVIVDLVLKHDALRVVQTLVKYLSKERREIIVKALQKNYYKLATLSYGKYLLVKLLHYGLKELRALIVDELHGKLRKLMRHKEGAYVVEDLFVLYLTAEQRLQMIREFWGQEYAVFKDLGKGSSVVDACNQSAERRKMIMGNLKSTIEAAVEKGSTGFQILHAVMREYVSVLLRGGHDLDVRELIETLADQFAELVHTAEGAEVALTLIAMANAKERKSIVRALKPHVLELAKNEFGHVVLVTVFMTVDDTVLVHKTLVADLVTPETVADLIQDKFSRRPLMYLLKGLDGKYFAPKSKDELARYETLAQTTLKKPQETRLKELQARAVPTMYESVLKSKVPFAQLVLLNLAAQFLGELLLLGSDEERKQVADEVFEAAFTGDVLEDFHPLNKTPFFGRLVKTAVQGTEFKWDSEKKTVVGGGEALGGLGTDFALRASEAMEPKITDWMQGQAAFVLFSVCEVLLVLEKKRAQALIKLVRKHKRDIDLDKGAAMLKKLIDA